MIALKEDECAWQWKHYKKHHLTSCAQGGIFISPCIYRWMEMDNFCLSHPLFFALALEQKHGERCWCERRSNKWREKGATEHVWASLRGAHWLPNMKKAIIIRRKWVEVRHRIPTRGESGKVSAVMCLIVKWVGPITTTPRCAQGEKW